MKVNNNRMIGDYDKGGGGDLSVRLHSCTLFVHSQENYLHERVVEWHTKNVISPPQLISNYYG